MSKRYELRRGDVCPCCGQRIDTDDRFRLFVLTSIAKYLDAEPQNRPLLDIIGFAWPEEADDG